MTPNRLSILIIKPSSLGDVVHTLPAVAAIRAANPDAEITWLINPEWATLLRGNPDIDHVRIFPRGDFRGLAAPLTLIPWLRQTRQLRPDIAADFQGLLRSALIGRISGAHQLFGLSDAREGARYFYDQVAPVDRRSHAVDRYLKLAETIGATIPSPLRFPLPSGDPLPRFDDYPPFILLHPSARGRGKSLSRAVVDEICGACSPTRVIVVGQAKLRIEAPENCVNLCGQTTLLQLIRLIRTAGFVITVDSGPMHIAAAVSDRLVSIHTWTDPHRVGPYNSKAWIWRNGDLQQMRDIPASNDIKTGRRFRTSDIGSVVELAQRLVANQISALAERGQIPPERDPPGTLS